jgi:hypothetical protein
MWQIYSRKQWVYDQLEVNLRLSYFFLFGNTDFFVYMDGHPQATVVLFPCSLATQGFKEATMGITCLFICLLFVFLAPRSVARGGSVAYMGFS